MSDATVEQRLEAAVLQGPPLSRTGLLERVFARLFQGLVYTQIWEDPAADMAALDLGARDDVVCIASGGCNAMSYLTAGPRSLHAVDLSPAHVALVKLKLAGALSLERHADFDAFFGRADLPSNRRLYDEVLAPALDPATRAYWDARPFGRRRAAIFERNLYRFGLLGRFISAVHVVARLGRVDFGPLLAARTLAEQERFYHASIAPLFELRIVRALARRRAALFGLGIPPAQYDKLAADAGGDALVVLRERVRRLVCDFPIGENYFAWQAFARRYGPGSGPDAARAVPPYLEPGAYPALRAAAGRATVENRSLTEALAAAPAGSKSVYVLLDAQDWMNDAQLDALWREISRTARPDARVIFRTGGRADILPGRVAPGILGQWRYDARRSREGFAADRSAIYGGFHLYARAETPA